MYTWFRYFQIPLALMSRVRQISRNSESPAVDDLQADLYASNISPVIIFQQKHYYPLTISQVQSLQIPACLGIRRRDWQV